MTITIDLPPDEEARLQKRAARQGKDLNSFVQDVVLREATQESYLEQPQESKSLSESAAEPPARSLAEMLHGRVGLFENEDASYVAQGPPSLEVLEGLIGVLESNHPDLAANSEDEFGERLVEEYRAQGLTFRDRK